MLLSMTGQGDGSSEQEGVFVAVEIRSINSRYFKLNTRISEGYTGLDGLVESEVRKTVRRGSVSVEIRIDRQSAPEDFRINAVAIEAYRRQLQEMGWEPSSVDPLLSLPGVVGERIDASVSAEQIWESVAPALTKALAKLTRMRTDEGDAMERDLRSQCDVIASELAEIVKLAPNVAESYRARLLERLNSMLAQFDVSVDASDIVREVGVFAERSDISEEIVRLRSHLEQFDTLTSKEGESNGRKLEFITQEMFRETNTIGSKANDADIARHVVEIKASIERMREMIQNVE